MSDLIPADIERFLAAIERMTEAAEESAETFGEVADIIDKFARTLARIEIELAARNEDNGKEKELITVYMDPRWENKYGKEPGV